MSGPSPLPGLSQDAPLPPALRVDSAHVLAQLRERREPVLDAAAERQALARAIRAIDLTTLEGTDTPAHVQRLCQRARHPGPGLPRVAAVCVYPRLVRVARDALQGSGVRVASVASGFPAGQLPLALRVAETRVARDEGADEVDVVIHRGDVLLGDWPRVHDELAALKEAAGGACLKVILETGELESFERIAWAAWVSCCAGADFVKTSTGKIATGATPEAVLCMLHVVRDYERLHGRRVGIKVSGGVRRFSDALRYLGLVAETLDADWLAPESFRIGASSLLDDLVARAAALGLAPTTGSDGAPSTTKTVPTGRATESDSRREILARARLAPAQHLFVGGHWRPSTSGESLPVLAPDTAAEISRIANASADDVDAAVHAARSAQPQWEALPGAERARILFAFAQLVHEHGEELALLESIETGVPLRWTRGQWLQEAQRRLQGAAGWTDKLEYALPGPRACGTCALLLPGHAALPTAAAHLGAALAAGNSAVLVPAPDASLTTLRLAELVARAGVPAGLVSVLTGGPALAAALATHPCVDVVAFDGGAAEADALRQRLAGTGQRVLLERGAPPIHVVLEDADQGHVVHGLVRALVLPPGPVASGARVFVQESILSSLVPLLMAALARVRIGDPLDETHELGPVHGTERMTELRDFLVLAQQEGARIQTIDAELPARGTWHAPALLLDVEPAMRVANSVIPGPLLALTSCRTAAEGIAFARALRHRTLAHVWTQDGGRALRVLRALGADVGLVNGAIPDGAHPIARYLRAPEGEQ